MYNKDDIAKILENIEGLAREAKNSLDSGLDQALGPANELVRANLMLVFALGEASGQQQKNKLPLDRYKNYYRGRDNRGRFVARS